MSKPLVSVIMAVHNDEEYLKSSILSVLNQSLKNFELIIIDDKSTDNSLNIIKSLMQKNKKIRLVPFNKNYGPSRARNKGLDIAKGKYVAINDSDDISRKNRLQTQYEFLEQNPDVFLIASSASIIFQGKEIFVKKNQSGSNYYKTKLPKANCITHSSVMFRKTNLRYREKFNTSMDYDFFLNILTNGQKIDCIPAPLVLYQIRKNSISTTNYSIRKLYSKKAREFYRQRLKFGSDNYDKFNPALEFRNIKDVEYEPYQFLIDICIYSDKTKAIKLLYAFRNQLPIYYIFRKLLLLLSPKYLMEKQKEIKG